jgi:hypothetical protein
MRILIERLLAIEYREDIAAMTRRTHVNGKAIASTTILKESRENSIIIA